METTQLASATITIHHNNQVYQINLKTISEFEGGQALTAYVPMQNGKVLGNSGVTVATGIDLGQMSSGEIMDLPLDFELRRKLQPYAELTKLDAVEFLFRNPLQITKAEADALDQAKGEKIFKVLIRLYNKDSQVKFEDLPKEAQTTLASIAWRRGPAFSWLPEYSEIWAAAINQDWRTVRSLLNEFEHPIKGIRKRAMREAAVLNSICV